MKHRLAVFAALAATVISAPAMAEERPDRAAMVEWGLALAGNVLPEGKLHTLRHPMCLRVAAEDRAFATAIAQRVVDNAAEAGVAIKRGRCQPNAVIVFTDDAVGQLRDMRRFYLQFYGSHYIEELDHLFATETTGFAFHEPVQLWIGPEAFRGQRPVIGQPDVLGAAVVIEQASTEGLDPLQLADYATMRLLAPTADTGAVPQEAPGAGISSILTLFRDRDRAPEAMTAFDRAYLHSLYRLPRGSTAATVMSRAAQVALADEGS